MKITVEQTRFWPFAKRIMWLAWQACGGPLGMGFLQDRPTATEEEVWENVASCGDYPHGKDIPGYRRPGEVHADYVFGRMMKLTLKFHDNAIEISDGWNRDYQAFCGKYPNAKALLDATAESLSCPYTEV
ncbi:unnamed protein product, partial [marine sediment metagenome]